MKSKLGITLVAVGCMSWLGLSGCSESGGLARVRKAHPDAEIVAIPDNPGNWIVRLPNGSIRYCFARTRADLPPLDDVELLPARKP